jgi:hypothetical protein
MRAVVSVADEENCLTQSHEGSIMLPLWFADENPYRQRRTSGEKSPEKSDRNNSESSSPASILIVDDSVDCRTILPQP